MLKIKFDNRMVKKLIIDTDTGVDDAMAILMALEAHKRFQNLASKDFESLTT